MRFLLHEVPILEPECLIGFAPLAPSTAVQDARRCALSAELPFSPQIPQRSAPRIHPKRLRLAPRHLNTSSPFARFPRSSLARYAARAERNYARSRLGLRLTRLASGRNVKRGRWLSQLFGGTFTWALRFNGKAGFRWRGARLAGVTFAVRGKAAKGPVNARERWR